MAHANMVFSPAAVGSRLLADLVQGNQMPPEFRDLLEGHIKSVKDQWETPPTPQGKARVQNIRRKKEQ